MDTLRTIRNVALITAAAGFLGLVCLYIGRDYKSFHEAYCNYHDIQHNYLNGGEEKIEFFMGTDGLFGCIDFSRFETPGIVVDTVCRSSGLFTTYKTCYYDVGEEEAVDGLVDKIILS